MKKTVISLTLIFFSLLIQNLIASPYHEQLTTSSGIFKIFVGVLGVIYVLLGLYRFYKKKPKTKSIFYIIFGSFALFTTFITLTGQLAVSALDYDADSAGQVFVDNSSSFKSKLSKDFNSYSNESINYYEESRDSQIISHVTLGGATIDIPQTQFEPAPSAELDITENKVKLVKEERFSTFSADTDDGSYKLFKQQIGYNQLVEKDLVRVEEFINAFEYNYPNASSIEKPFSTHLKVMNSPWSDNKLMLIGVKGFEYNIDTLPPINLTFLVDVSGSMSHELPKIQAGLKMLVNKLRDNDRISLVTYAGSTEVVLSNIEIKEKSKIISSINQLSSGGGTYGEAGIKLAYKENESGFIKGGVNRIILMSDGDFNVGVGSIDNLKELIKEKRKSKITFSTIGIGGSNYRDNLMEQMSNVGNGNYTYIGDIHDAREVFADRFVSTIKNIAKDVKYQVEFNPNLVKEYRLIGYENRMLNKEDFNNDKIDAGEIPSGITTTAIYEITLVDQKGLYPESRYDKESEEINTELSNELAFLNIRYKKPAGNKSVLLQFPVNKNIINQNINSDNVFAVNVAGFAQLYRDSDYISNEFNYDSIIKNLENLELNFKQEEFLNLVKTTKNLIEVK